MRILVAYDGTLQAKDALRYGLKRAKEENGEVVALHVFNSGMFVAYDALPWAEDVAREESDGHVAEGKAIIDEAGRDVRARIVTEDGNPEEEILRYVAEHEVDVLLCTPRYGSVMKKLAKRHTEDAVTNGGGSLGDRAVMEVAVFSRS